MGFADARRQLLDLDVPICLSILMFLLDARIRYRCRVGAWGRYFESDDGRRDIDHSTQRVRIDLKKMWLVALYVQHC